MNWWEGLLYLASMLLIAAAGLWVADYTADGLRRPRWRDVLNLKQGFIDFYVLSGEVPEHLTRRLHEETQTDA